MAKSSLTWLTGIFMTRVCLHRAIALLAAVGALAMGTPAAAQHVWLDEKGVKHYSDQPPPPSVPKNRILKGPGAERKAAEPADPAPAPPAAQTPAKAPMMLAERNADFQKRRAEQAEKEKKAAEEARLAQEKAKSCERARNYQRVLESGERIATTDKNGERSFLSDQQRAQELQEARRMVQDCR